MTTGKVTKSSRSSRRAFEAPVPFSWNLLVPSWFANRTDELPDFEREIEF